MLKAKIINIKKNLTFSVTWLSLLFSCKKKKPKQTRTLFLAVHCKSSFTVNMLICDTYGSAHTLLGKVKPFNQMPATKKN